jgi:hypothetical protein
MTGMEDFVSCSDGGEAGWAELEAACGRESLTMVGARVAESSASESTTGLPGNRSSSGRNARDVKVSP